MRTAAHLLRPSQLALRGFRCPACGPSLLVRLSASDIGVRCMRCAASAMTLSLMCVVKESRPGLGGEAVYELSSRGPLFEFLRREVPRLTFSEFFDDLEPGAWREGVQCQDVQRLTFEDSSFDVVTSNGVFEHVANDARGFCEVRRVLRPGGIFVFTVPLYDAEDTVERARMRDGAIEYLLPPEYHGDRIRGRGRVLVYRNYGRDITERVRNSGFRSADIDWRFKSAFLGKGSGVVVAQV
ncbi:MAG: class I SAM-dependent methyltransferase [Burkholderiales bacterium]